MGWYVTYIYNDIDDSYRKINPKGGERIVIKGFDLIIDNERRILYGTDNFARFDLMVNYEPLVVITTMIKYSLKENYDLNPLEDYLLSMTNSKIYRVDEYILGEWEGINSDLEDYWMDDARAVEQFFEWLPKQDKYYWSVL